MPSLQSLMKMVRIVIDMRIALDETHDGNTVIYTMHHNINNYDKRDFNRFVFTINQKWCRCVSKYGTCDNNTVRSFHLL